MIAVHKAAKRGSRTMDILMDIMVPETKAGIIKKIINPDFTVHETGNDK